MLLSAVSQLLTSSSFHENYNARFQTCTINVNARFLFLHGNIPRDYSRIFGRARGLIIQLINELGIHARGILYHLRRFAILINEIMGRRSAYGQASIYVLFLIRFEDYRGSGVLRALHGVARYKRSKDQAPGSTP